VVSTPGDRAAAARTIGETHHGAGIIARGLGRAYGDSAFVAGGTVLQTARIDRFRDFDPQSGLLDVEAGVSFAEIIATFLPRGWFLPTTPGTKYVTVGGAIAADVHGKNHHRHGSIGMFVDRIDVCVADGTVVSCSRGENADLFHATLGGMGLTGVIVAASFRLMRVESSRVTVDYRRTADLEETLTVFEAGDAGSEHSVAWID
jgi:FAD/FMN-containing dehydrogenase